MRQGQSSTSTLQARTESGFSQAAQTLLPRQAYFGGAGVNTSRLCAGSGLGLGLGAFLTSFLPLSLLPMRPSVPQKGGLGKGLNSACNRQVNLGLGEAVYFPMRLWAMVSKSPLRKLMDSGAE
jgi:hypothetical protein